MNTRIVKSIIFITIIMIMPTFCWGGTYYCSPSGTATWTSSANDNTPCSLTTVFSNVSAGDIVYLRGGIYNIPSPGYTASKSGSSGSPITLKAYTGESPILKASGSWSGRQALIWGEASYWVIDGLTFTAALTVDSSGGDGLIVLGENSNANYWTIQNCNLSITSTTGRDNLACIVLRAYRSNYAIIQNNTITGIGNTSSLPTYGCSGIQYLGGGNVGVKIKYNEISGCTLGVYIKHANGDTSLGSGAEIAYNYLYNNYSGIYGNPVYINIHDNIIPCSSGGRSILLGDNGGGSQGRNCVINHNTLFSGIELWSPSEGPIANCTISNNILSTRTTYGSTLTLNTWYNNLIGNAAAQGTGDIGYTTATYVGGSSPATISGFTLKSDTDGSLAASDKTNMGADVSMVGIQTDAINTTTSDTTKPTITITSPTTDSIYTSSNSTVTIAGLASDNVGVAAVTWADNNGRSGSAFLDSSTWSISNIALFNGQNVFNIAAWDAADNNQQITITITYTTQSFIPETPKVDSVSTGTQNFTTDVIFHDEFEDGLTMAQKYADYNSASGSCDISTLAGFGGSAHSARAHWAAGQVDAGSFAYMFGRNPITSQTRSTTDFREIYWRFYVKTSDNWIGNPIKLTRATVFAGSNWSQAMVAHIWGESSSENVLEMDPASGINSNNQLSTTTYNDTTNMQWLGVVKGSTAVYDTSRSNTWQCIEAHVKLNTPGSSDGVFEFWVDGNLEARRDNLNWVGTWQSYGLNAVMFGNHNNSGAPEDQDRFMDNIVISTKPIGLATSSVNPKIYKSIFADPDTGDTQSAFYAQVSTSQDINGLVWAGGVSGNYDSVTVNTSYGVFQGARAGKTALNAGTVHYTRVRQVDSTGLTSQWSDWKIFKTEGSAIVAPIKPGGVEAKVVQ